MRVSHADLSLVLPLNLSSLSCWKHLLFKPFASLHPSACETNLVQSKGQKSRCFQHDSEGTGKGSRKVFCVSSPPTGTATLQMSQISMRIRQQRAGQTIDIPGSLPPVLTAGQVQYLTTTILLHYGYEEREGHHLKHVTACAIPNGRLQNRYNPVTPNGGNRGDYHYEIMAATERDISR
jgi:hypothetical protein